MASFRRIVLRFMAAGLLVMTPGLAESAGRSEPSVPQQVRTARIEFFVGTAMVNGAPATIGAAVQPGSRIETGPDGIVDIIFGDRNALRVFENTALTLNLADLTRGVEVERGTIGAVFEGLQSVGVGAHDTFRIRTPTTIAGVRGTVFFIKIEDVDNTYVCTCHGELAFDQLGLTIRAARHAGARFTLRDGQVTSSSAAEIYHDSDVLNRIADIVGVTIAWGEEPR